MERVKKRRIRPWWELNVHITGDGLKWLGFVCMCLSTFSTAVVQRGILHLDTVTMDALYELLLADGQVKLWATVACVTMLLAVVALPIYAKLLYDGWVNTSDRKKYILRLAGLALVSEFAYDFAASGSLVDMSAQNPAWALVISAVMLTIFDYYKEGKTRYVIRAFVLFAALGWVMIFQSYLGAVTVLLVACNYFVPNKKAWRNILSVAICLSQYTAPLGLIFTSFHDGSRPKTDKRVFYALYPLQLIVFGLITQWM